MKSKLTLEIRILVLLIGILAIGCNSTTSKKEKVSTKEDIAQTIYTCPMHPEVEQNEPGNCPKCGMKLEVKKATMHQSNMQMNDTVYTCPMHPEVEKLEPGKCPECGMALIVKKTDMEHSHDDNMHE